jgi:hypothetical protein
MYRMYGIAQGARDGGVRMYRMYGIAQGARDGGARMYRMYGQIYAPDNICTSAIRGGRIAQGVKVGKERRVLQQTSSN